MWQQQHDHLTVFLLYETTTRQKNMSRNELRLKKKKNIKVENVHHTCHTETEI